MILFLVMIGRRSFLVSSGLTATTSRSAFGANDRIQAEVIGAGTRGGMRAPPPAHEDPNVTFRHLGQPTGRAHVRNFLDCVKSRQQPITSMETGLYSALPLPPGAPAIRTGKSYRRTGQEAVAT